MQKLGSELEESRASSISKISDLDNQHRLEYGKLLKTHREVAAQMDVEKEDLKERSNMADRTIEEKDHEVSKLQSANSDLTLQAKQLISTNEQIQEQLIKSQEEVKGLLEKIDEKDDTVQKYKEKLARPVWLSIQSIQF